MVATVTSRPASRMRPLRGGRSPAITSSSSRCPLPSTPAIPTISPAWTTRSMPRRAGTPRSSAASTSRSASRGSRCPAERVATTLFEVAADHQPPERPSIGRAGRHGRDQPSAAQHRDAIGEAQHLVELVADEDDRAAIGREAAQHGQKLVHLLRGQHGRRLVEDQDLGAAIERFQDLDALLLADRQAVDTCVRIDREAVAPRELGDARRDRPAILEQRRARRGLPEHQVLGDGERRHQHEVLMHHAEPMADGVVRRAEPHRLPAQPDLSLVRPVQAVEDAHQRRLAGAVLAEQRQDLALAAARGRSRRWRACRRETAW